MLKSGSYFLKDKKAQILKPEKQRNARGDFIINWVPLSPTGFWCYTKSLNGKISFDGKVIIAHEEERVCVFNYISDLKQGYRIKYKDTDYEITRCFTVDDYHSEAHVFTKKIA